MKKIKESEKRNPIILVHGLWNTSSIFSSLISKLDDIGIEYFAPTLKHSYGMTSIIDLTHAINESILDKYGLEKELDILGFSMGGIIGRYWIQKFNGYKRTRRFISIGSPHKGTLMAQLIPKYPFRGISEMKINSCPNSLSSSRTPTLAQSLIFSIFKKVSIFKNFKDLYVYI